MELSDIKIILKKRRSIEKDYRNYCKNLFKYLSEYHNNYPCDNIFELIEDKWTKPQDYYDKIYNQDKLSFEELLNLYYIVSKKYHNNSWFNFHCNSVGDYCNNECYGEKEIRYHLLCYSWDSRIIFFRSRYKTKGLRCASGLNIFCIFCNNCNNCKNCINCNNCNTCVDCEYCNECSVCKNCNYSNNIDRGNECDYCDSGYHCEKCDHCHLVEQRKDKHFEQVIIA